MSNSATNLDLIFTNQAGKERTANAIFDAVSPASLFGRRDSTTGGLVFGYYGGTMIIDGVETTIANGTVTFTTSAIFYLQASRTGVVSFVTDEFTPGKIPLYRVVTNAITIDSWEDFRPWCANSPGLFGLKSIAMPNLNKTLTCQEARNHILQFTGTLTAARDVIVPLEPQQWTVFNNTTGGFGLRFIGATGTGITVAATKRAVIYSDGTNVVRVSPDT